MAKRYHSGAGSAMLKETSGWCHLPENVEMKDFPKDGGFKHEGVNSLYGCVESQMANDRSELERITSPKKF